MLLTDRGLLTIADLVAEETNLQTIVTALGINVDVKFDRMVRLNFGPKIQRMAMRASNFLWNPQIYTQLFNDAQTTAYRNQQVVWTGELEAWATAEMIASVYRDAWARKNDDKYESKMEYYQEESGNREENYYTNGIGMVFNPMPQPDKPSTSLPTGGALLDRVYNIRITWAGLVGGSIPIESAASLTLSVTVPANKLLTVDITNLTPPAGQILAGGQTPIQYATATGWYVYAGDASIVDPDSDPVAPSKQNTSAIAIATKTWTEPTGGLIVTGAKIGSLTSADGWGLPVGSGQAPDVYRTVGRKIQRG